MAKQVTITNTKPSADTLWFWESTTSPAWDSQDQFLQSNSDKITQQEDVVGNVQTVVLTFSDDAIFAEYKRVLQLGVKSEYVQYCQDNGITINVVMEDI